VDDVFKQQVSSDLATRPAVATTTTTTSSGSYKVESPRDEGSARRPAAVASVSSGDTCKFESSPGGCRFGSSCRFKHSTPGAVGGYTAGPSSSSGAGAASGGKAPCMYFARGNCQNGDKCRFGHY
jgi:hypothetical protein